MTQLGGRHPLVLSHLLPCSSKYEAKRQVEARVSLVWYVRTTWNVNFKPRSVEHFPVSLAWYMGVCLFFLRTAQKRAIIQTPKYYDPHSKDS